MTHLKQRTRERGTVLLLATVTILVVVGMLALAVDIGYLMSGRGQLQNAVDAAALAGAQGIRTAIEPNGASTERNRIVRNLAKQYASLNSVKKVGDTSRMILEDNGIIVDFPVDYPVHQPRVTVKHRMALPTIFGNIFGISSMTVSAGAIASTTFVDGGTGMISGCWRPLLIPDSFYGGDDGKVYAISDRSGRYSDGSTSPTRCKPLNSSVPSPPCTYRERNPQLSAGDFYMSRFASTNANSTRNSTHFRDSLKPGSPIVEATGIRDAQNLNDLRYVNGIEAGRNLMGQRMVLKGRGSDGNDIPDYRIVDFAGSGINGDFPADPVQQIQRGCCTPIRVGQLVQVVTPDNIGNLTLYDNFRAELFRFYTANGFSLPTPESIQYRYAQSRDYPTPNANPLVIPVLLCSPIEFGNSKSASQFYVTNIGAFYLEGVSPYGDLQGHFVREVMTAGTSLQPQDEVPNASLLPISVSLIR